MSGPGRPRKDWADRRDQHVSARLTTQELILLEKFAGAEGITPSSAVRWLVCGCLSNSDVRSTAIASGSGWMDLMPSEKMQVLADSPSLFKAEALSRLSVEDTGMTSLRLLNKFERGGHPRSDQ